MPLKKLHIQIYNVFTIYQDNHIAVQTNPTNKNAYIYYTFKPALSREGLGFSAVVSSLLPMPNWGWWVPDAWACSCASWEFWWRSKFCRLHLNNSVAMQLPHIAMPKPANVARRTDSTACTWNYNAKHGQYNALIELQWNIWGGRFAFLCTRESPTYQWIEHMSKQNHQCELDESINPNKSLLHWMCQK